MALKLLIFVYSLCFKFLWNSIKHFWLSKNLNTLETEVLKVEDHNFACLNVKLFKSILHLREQKTKALKYLPC
jgi:hypothetical protein